MLIDSLPKEKVTFISCQINQKQFTHVVARRDCHTTNRLSPFTNFI
ncbi:Uncharacterised protein [Bacillus pumilus]|nr:Uncharacterised protein [Bacillus pumilus]